MNQGFKEEEFAFLSDMLGPKGMAFDNDEVLDDSDDEDLKNDPVSHMDMQVSLDYILSVSFDINVFHSGTSRIFSPRMCRSQHKRFC